MFILVAKFNGAFIVLRLFFVVVDLTVPTFVLKDVEKKAFYDKGHPAVTRNTQTGYYCAPANAVDANLLCGEIGYKGGGMVKCDFFPPFCRFSSFYNVVHERKYE